MQTSLENKASQQNGFEQRDLKQRAGELAHLHEQLIQYFSPKTDIISKADTNIIASIQDQARKAITVRDIQNLLVMIHHYRQTSSKKDQSIEELLRSLESQCPSSLTQLAFKIHKTYLFLLYPEQAAAALAGIQIPPKTTPQKSDIVIQKTLKIRQNENGAEITPHDETPIDYLIIGSGPAGCVIAHEILGKRPLARVVILDSGSFLDPNTIDASLDADFIESHNLRTTDTGGIILRNANVVGGGSTINIDLAFSPLLDLVKRNLTDWIDSGALDSELIHQNDQDSNQNSPKNWQHLQSAYNWVTKTIGTRSLSQSEVNPNNRILLNGISTARLYDLNQKPFDSKNAFLKNSAVSKLLLPALERYPDRFSVLSDAWVEKIVFTTDPSEQKNRATFGQKKAIGVIVHLTPALSRTSLVNNVHYFAKSGEIASQKTSFKIKAKKIILSAGTLGSAGILLRSNIENNNIGRGIVLHPS